MQVLFAQLLLTQLLITQQGKKHEHVCVTTQAWQAESPDDGQGGRSWSAPAQPQSRQWETQPAVPHQPSQGFEDSDIMAWPPIQQARHVQQPNAVPSAVQQRAAQYAGDEGLARPPTRPPSDWWSRQGPLQGDEALAVPSEQPSSSLDRCCTHSSGECHRCTLDCNSSVTLCSHNGLDGLAASVLYCCKAYMLLQAQCS